LLIGVGDVLRRRTIRTFDSFDQGTLRILRQHVVEATAGASEGTESPTVNQSSG
jgi:hypothetical protein